MTEHAPDRIWSGIDIPKTIAGVLAAVSAAVVGSFLGVAGTLVGAAVASIVGSVGTEIYQRWINRGSKKIAATLRRPRRPRSARPRWPPRPTRSPSQPEPGRAPPTHRGKIRWGRVAMVAAARVRAGDRHADRVRADHRQERGRRGGGHRSKATTTVCSVLCGDERQGKAGSGAVGVAVGQSPVPTSTPSSPAAGHEHRADRRHDRAGTGHHQRGPGRRPRTSHPTQRGAAEPDRAQEPAGRRRTWSSRTADRTGGEAEWTVSDILLDGFGRIPDLVRGAVHGLTPEQLRWAPAQGANPIGWLVWHLTRVQDSHLAELIGAEQVYVTGDWAAAVRPQAGPVRHRLRPLGGRGRRGGPGERPGCCSTTTRPSTTGPSPSSAA